MIILLLLSCYFGTAAHSKISVSGHSETFQNIPLFYLILIAAGLARVKLLKAVAHNESRGPLLGRPPSTLA